MSSILTSRESRSTSSTTCARVRSPQPVTVQGSNQGLSWSSAQPEHIEEDQRSAVRDGEGARARANSARPQAFGNSLPCLKALLSVYDEDGNRKVSNHQNPYL